VKVVCAVLRRGSGLYLKLTLLPDYPVLSIVVGRLIMLSAMQTQSAAQSPPVLDIRSMIYDAAAALGSKSLLKDDILPRVTTLEDIIRFVSRYQLFNGNFAGGVSCLAGAFHIRQDLFRDCGVNVFYAADRSARIASQIYFAAVDEYADRKNQQRFTHWDLGQYLLLGVCNYFEVDLTTIDHTFPLNVETQLTIDRVSRGYCLDQQNTEDSILRGLGFHIGSELLADQEFNLIDEHLRENFLPLVQYLEDHSTEFGNTHYHWIHIHTFVEMEHLDHAFKAAELSIEYYSGQKSKRRVAELILDGFLEFGDMQKFFFGNILNKPMHN